MIPTLHEKHNKSMRFTEHGKKFFLSLLSIDINVFSWIRPVQAGYGWFASRLVTFLVQ